MQPDGTWIKTAAEENKLCAQDYFQSLAEKRIRTKEMTLAEKLVHYIPVR